MVLCPPGSAKSTFCSVLFPPWFFAQRPNLDLIGVSHSSDLAESFSGRAQSFIRQYPGVLDYSLASENVKRWRTTNGGVYRAAGVGGSVTGHRGDGGLIDDPLRGAADAESGTIRDGQWEWYQAEFYTRLKPGAWIVLIMCMTGDTPVRMEDGVEQRLDAIRPGDRVATYDNGCLSSARVLAWKEQGEDDVFELRMASGKSVKANKRHPFLVDRHGKLVWIRLGNIRLGEKLVRLSCLETYRGNGENGAESRAPQMDANIRQNARASACHTMTKIDGQPESAAHLTPAKNDASFASDTDTVLSLRTSTPCSWRKGDSVPYASSHPRLRTAGRTGTTSSASTMTTEPTPCADSSATTVTSCSRTRTRTQRHCAPLPDTSKRERANPHSFGFDEVVAITPAGRAVVYDVQIERTENFIANGLVSHNTRWHPDDLGGRLLQAAQAGGDQWTVLKLPAICDSLSDPLGRPLGAALWPEWQDVADLEQIRANVGPYVWGALYQQDPQPRGASFFNLDDLLVNGAPVPMPTRCDTVFAIVDTAIKSGQQHNSTAVTWYSYNSLVKPSTFILDWDIIQIEGAAQEAWLPSVFTRGEELARQCGARQGFAGAMIEDKATGTVLIQQAQNKGWPAYAIDSKLTAMGKEERAIAASPYVIAGDIKITEEAFNKTKIHKGRSANHFITEVTNFRLGSKETDGLDLLDTFCYGVSVTRGTASGKRKGI
jgi:hypothetical protein